MVAWLPSIPITQSVKKCTFLAKTFWLTVWCWGPSSFSFISCAISHLWFKGMCISHFCEIRSIVISASLSMCREVQHGALQDWNATAYQLLAQLYQGVIPVSCDHFQIFYRHMSISGLFSLLQFCGSFFILWYEQIDVCYISCGSIDVACVLKLFRVESSLTE